MDSLRGLSLSHENESFSLKDNKWNKVIDDKMYDHFYIFPRQSSIEFTFLSARGNALLGRTSALAKT